MSDIRQTRMSQPVAMLAIALGLGATGQALAGDLPIERPEPSSSCVVGMRVLDSGGRTLAVVKKVRLRPNESIFIALPTTLEYKWQPLHEERSPMRAEITSMDPAGFCPAAQSMQLVHLENGRMRVVTR